MRVILRMVIWAAATTLTASSACAPNQPASAPKPAPPAKVENPVKEADLATITLSPEAEKRLGIEVVEVQRKPMPRTRVFGGDIVVPVGGTITVSAPLAGTVQSPAGRDFPAPGEEAKAGTILARLRPAFSSADTEVLPLSDRISLIKARADLAAARNEAQGQVDAARVRVDAARAKLARAEQLRRENAGSDKAVEDARAELDLARTDLEAAARKLEQFSANQLALSEEKLDPLSISTPISGVVRTVHVASGQAVPAGTPMFEVISLETVWVRVPVYVGELRALDLKRGASVGNLNDRVGAARETATLLDVPAPPEIAAARVPLHFALKNHDRRWMPGEIVGVTLFLKESPESLVVPWAAVLFDIHGGTWVYENKASHVFVRRRVSVQHVSGDLAALARGPERGTRVVTSGAAELFGTEFGIGK